MKASILKASIGLVLSCVALCVGARAQTTAISSIAGTVRDANGAVVVGAEVRATQTDTGLLRTVNTGSDGTYSIPNLPVGPYKLQVSSEGFSAYVQSGIILQVNMNPQINVVLQVGAVTQSIEVHANTAMLETHDNGVGTVIDRQRVADLPLNGRQATQLVLLSGAAVSSPSGNTVGNKNYPSAVGYSVAGGQGNGTVYLLDGGANNDFFSNVNLPAPFPDALQEFSVLTNALPAQYGLHAGGVVNMVTKSGTNAIHGDIFEYIRNGVFDARNYFASKRDTLKRNQFGGVVGGPIKKDKLFYFLGYQGTWNRSTPPTTIAHVPNAAMLAGDFTVAASNACNTSNITLKAPFVNNKISPTQFNQQALNFLSHVPISTDPCGTIQFGIVNNNREDQGLARVDYTASDKQNIFVRYMISDYLNPAVGNPTNILASTTPGLAYRVQQITIGDTYLITSRLINSVHITGTRESTNRFAAPGTPTPTQLGINQYSPAQGQLNVTDTNFFSISPLLAYFHTNVVQGTDDANFSWGAHQFTFGANWIHVQFNNQNSQFANGQWTFNGQATGYGLSDFLLGLPNQFRQGNTQLDYNHSNYFAAYAQDSWKINSRLNLNIGLRWEPYDPNRYTDKEVLHFDMGDFLAGKKSTVFVNAPAGLSFPGDSNFTTGNAFEAQILNRWAPRVGLVWDPLGDGKQTVRASYGIMNDTPEAYFEDFVSTGPPWGNLITNTNLPGGFTNPWSIWPGGNPFPPQLPPPANAVFQPFSTYTAIPAHLYPLYMQQWNVSVQRQLSLNWLVTATYLGNKTTHMWLDQEINPAVYVPGTCGSTACSTVANTNNRRLLNTLDPVNGGYYGIVLATNPGGNAEYNGLLVAVEHRFSHHYSVLANYTISHCINEGEAPGDNSNTANYQNPYNLKANRGNCASDHRQIFNSSFIFEAPRFNQSALRFIVSGWQLSPILTASTGAYETPLTGVDSSLTGVGLDQPNIVGNPQVSGSFKNWFNPKAFASNTPGTYGNAGRSLITMPSAWNLDTGLMRTVKIREPLSVQFRAEAFNLFNHATAATTGLHLSMNDPLFGSINAANDPRILEFSLKIMF